MLMHRPTGKLLVVALRAAGGDLSAARAVLVIAPLFSMSVAQLSRYIIARIIVSQYLVSATLCLYVSAISSKLLIW